MKVTKPMIMTALVAGSLLAGNLALCAADTNTPPAGAPPAGPKGPGGPGGAGGGRLGFDHMAQQLELTDDQKPKVKAILDDTQQKMLALRQDTSLSQEDRQAKRKALRDDTSSQMKAILTPEQFEKWQKMSAPRGPRNGPPSGGPKAGGTNAPAAPPKE